MSPLFHFQVREVTATLCQPLTLTGSWDGLESGDLSYQRPSRRPQLPQAKEGDQAEGEKVVQGKFERGLRVVCIQIGRASCRERV